MKRLLITAIFVFCVCMGVTAQAASYSQNESETTGRLYGIGSVSKVFTAAAVMKLVDEGKLDLDTPLTTYIPEFIMDDPRYTDITPRMLLSHSSGLMGMTDNDVFLSGDNTPVNHDRFLEYLSAQRLKHDPGELSVYSNDSFTLAEILVERVSGVSFTEFIEQKFSQPLGLHNIKTPQSDFDRALLSAIYQNGVELKAESVNVIGSGGIYSSMEDLCRFAAIFMDSADGSVLSKASVNEMAADQHKNPMVDYDADTIFRYGLGWDCVNTYPFNTLGITALSKGGDTGKYHTNLTVLPEYNIAVSVSSSGDQAAEQFIAQEIILAVLKEEGLIDDTALELPENNEAPAVIPKSVKAYEGLYDFGMGGYLLDVKFSGDKLSISSVGTANDRTQIYQYTQGGEFISTDGDYFWILGLTSAAQGTRGVTDLRFSEDEKGHVFIITQTYENTANLSQWAMAFPVAQRLEPNEIQQALTELWRGRSEKTYLLVSERYSSLKYYSNPIARIALNDMAPGYVGGGNYQGAGLTVRYAQIMDETSALGWQSIPTMSGRDTQDLTFDSSGGIDTLNVNNYRFVSEDVLRNASEINGTVRTGKDAVWYRIDDPAPGQKWSITVPSEASYFVYDKDFNILASSLEAQEREFVSLPRDGYIAFVGNNAEFQISVS